MDHSFSHVLLTRFNVRLSSPEKPPSDDWIAHRLDLFQRYCVPSVASQTVQNFRWIVLIDSRTSMATRRTILLNRKIQPLELCELEEFNSDYIAKYISPIESKFLVSSRLDNDDALHETFIEQIQQTFCAQPCQWINFPRGYVVDEQKGIFLSRQTSNAFISLIETAAKPRTVFCVNHRLAGTVGPVSQIDNGPMWIQLVHGTNLSNHVRPTDVPITTDLRGFNVRFTPRHTS